MGSCVSLHKDPDSAINLRLSVQSKNDNLLIPSPVKEKPDTLNGGDRTVAHLPLNSRCSPPRFPNSGSKDEPFFDSQPWLESDCEDDFLSVNGDFTPSRGSTPVHHKFSSGNPPANKAPAIGATLGSVPEPSPPDKKKRLSELFKESLRHQDEDDDNTATVENVVPDKVKAEATNPVPGKSTDGTPRFSGVNSEGGSERTPNGVLLEADEKPLKSAQCCLPRLLPTRSFSERKKKMSPAHSVGR
ncbi:hypothetical protein Salat_1375000 [Sesamum alatum]|uniref:Uncharacterized protein n=1 Tax=Sesamum alatum TaxID=300844 RepID=A0AAE2CL05_9LAMI|nr:hypothetical protein Salat_1375000 [Sesamum alatum]